MAPSRSGETWVHRRKSIVAVVVGIAVGVLMIAVNVAPAATPASVHAPPKATAPAQLPRLLPSPAATSTVPGFVDPQFVPTTLTSPEPSNYSYYGDAVAASGHLVAIGAPYQATEGSYGAVYLVNTVTGVTTWFPNPEGDAGVDFGGSVALSGGYLAVGASDAYDEEGAVFLYQAQGGAWNLVAELTSPNAQPQKANYSVFPGVIYQYAGDFGGSVALSGSTLVVGASGENASGIPSAGHVYVYNLQGLYDYQDALVKVLASPQPQFSGLFGYSVGISGNRVVVGAPEQDGSGEAYLFAASTGDLIQTFLSLNPIFPGEGFSDYGSLFGYSVAINATYVAVGAPTETVGFDVGGGRAYVFNLLNGSEEALNLTGTTGHPLFGISVAINPSTVLVGAPGANVSAGPETPGAAWLYGTTSGGQISSEFVSSNPGFLGEFGTSVAETGSQFIVGAPTENASGYFWAGHVYVFTQVPLSFTNAQGELAERLGNSVAVNVSVVVGAPDWTDSDSSYAEQGAAYVLASHTGAAVTLLSPAPAYDADFGYAVGVAGSTVVVGSPGGISAYQFFNGSAYLFSTSGNYERTLVSPDPGNFSFFGYSVAIAGNLVVIGAPGENVSGVALSGAVYVYSASTGDLLYSFLNPAPQTNGYFGYSVAVANGEIVVGAPGQNAENGTVYVYSAHTGSLLFTLAPPSADTSTFGYSVAIGGSTIVVGAPASEFAGVFESGEAYIYSSSAGTLKATAVTPNPAFEGQFGSAVADNGGTIVVGAKGETAYGAGDSGNVYLVNPSNGAVLDRYNAPNPSTDAEFGASVAIGPAGVIAVGAPDFGIGGAYLFFL